MPANAEIILTFVSEDEARIAFPLVTGDADTVGTRPFTIVNRSIADILVASAPGATGGVDDTKSILTFYVGNGGYSALRGLPGVTVSYEGPEADKPINYIVPIGNDPGVAVGSADVVETSYTGNGFVGNVEPGDYTMTFDAGNRTCAPDFGWPGAEGSAPNTFRVPTLPGFATFTFVRCKTEESVTTTGTINDLIAGEVVADAEVCVYWNEDAEGNYADSECQTTDAEGAITHTIPGDTQFLLEAKKEGYMTVVGTGETLAEDITWAGPLSPAPAIVAAAALAGVTVEEGQGHSVVTVLSPEGELLDGFTVSIVGSDATPAYIEGGLINTELTETSRSGSAFFFNLEPGSYTIDVQKEGVLCTTSATSWLTAAGYTAPIRSDSITVTAVRCIAEPSPRFGEPAEPIEAPMCGDDATANCMATCGFFAACGAALCEGLQDASEWETSAATAGMLAACEAVCETTPELIDIVCEHTSCNETLSLAVAGQEGFDAFCTNGLPTLLEQATIAAAAEDSIVTAATGLVGESESVQTALSAPGPLTVFLPVDEAFAALDMGLLEMVTTDPALRDLVLSYHVVDAGLPAADVIALIEGGADSVETLVGSVPLTLLMDKSSSVVRLLSLRTFSQAMASFT